MGYGLFCLVAFLYEIGHPFHYSDGPHIFFPIYLRRLITGFGALGFIAAAVITVLFHISKFHLLWFAPLWHFFGLPRWFKWIYLYSNPELIDLIYPESHIPWWFSLLCPLSPSLVPDIIRKLHKNRAKNAASNSWSVFPKKFVNSTDKTLKHSKRNHWPPKNLEEMNKLQRTFFWIGAGPFVYLIIMVILTILLMVSVILGFRDAEKCMSVIYGGMKSIALMIGIVALSTGFIYIFRTK